MDVSDLNFERDGAEIISGAVSFSEMETVARAFALNPKGRPGRRVTADDLALAPILAADGSMGRLAACLVPERGARMRPVRVVLFDKTAATNWAVPWHQDRTIAVVARHDVDGFANWNRKDGVDHVEPPIELLSKMVTLRLHLDPTGADNGALDILPGSHKLGRLRDSELPALVALSKSTSCVADVGDILAMRLTTVHKSDRSASPSNRRVLHVDYSADLLPLPLQWAMTGLAAGP